MTIENCIINVSGKCQLFCPFCRAGEFKNKYLVRDGFISEKTICNIMKKIPFTRCNYFNWGEPFLHPKLINLIKIGKQNDKIIEIHSNMQNLGAMSVEDIVKSGLDILCVSCDGTTQEVYEKYRVGGFLDKLIFNASQIAKIKGELGYKTPKIYWRMIVNRFNEHQVEEFEQFAKNYGADEAVFSGMYAFTPEGRKRINTYKAKDKKWDMVENIGNLGYCERVFDRIAIDWNGDVYTCCEANGLEQFKMGNINEQTFDEIYNGEKYKYARRFCSNSIPEDNGFDILCHSCFNKFPNDVAKQCSVWSEFL